MSESFTIEAEARADAGKGASRRLRRLENKIPAIIYGGDAAPVNISLIRKDFEKLLENEAVFTAILDVNVGGTTENVILKDIQRHPAKGFSMHADFLRVQADKPVKVNVPLHFTNEEKCDGVKLGGGMIQHQATEVEVSCLPKDLPEYIEVDMLNVKVGEIVHLSDIALPTGVTSTALALGDDHDLAIAAVIPPKGGKSADDAEGEAGDDTQEDAES